MTTLYFAYGSNMSSERLMKRVPSAERICIGKLAGRVLVCRKRSIDGSSKCDIVKSDDPTSVVYGVLFGIDESELPALDRAEGYGKGYDKEIVLVADSNGAVVKALTYVATAIDTTLRPYSWYLQHVLHGATSNLLPEEYIERLRSIESIMDPDAQRHEKELAIYTQFSSEQPPS